MTRLPGGMAVSVAVALVWTASLFSATVARAQEPGCGSEARGVCPITSVAKEEGFEVGGSQEQPQGQTAGSRPRGPLSPTYVDTNLIPTCTGNSYFDGGALCNAAVQTCPEGQIRFWVFEATIQRSTGRPAPGTGPQLVDTVCRGANDPRLDPAVALPALVRSEFQTVVVVTGDAQVSPNPETLVNVPTRFRTNAPASYDIPLTLLNQSVIITATAQRYVWHLGDAVRTSTQPAGLLEHTYQRAGGREVFVEIEWSGTFRVNGGDPQQIAGTVTTDGAPTTIQVQQARSELVRD